MCRSNCDLTKWVGNKLLICTLYLTELYTICTVHDGLYGKGRYAKSRRKATGNLIGASSVKLYIIHRKIGRGRNRTQLKLLLT